MPYDATEEAVELAKRGEGSLVGSVFTDDDGFAREMVLGVAPPTTAGCCSPTATAPRNRPATARRCRRSSMAARAAPAAARRWAASAACMHYMQRTALQGSPRR